MLTFNCLFTWLHCSFAAISSAAGLYMGGVGHYWYQFLDNKFVGNSFKMIKYKLGCEVLIGPPFAASIISLTGLLDQKPLTQIWSNLKTNVPYLLAVSLVGRFQRFHAISSFSGWLGFLHTVAISKLLPDTTQISCSLRCLHIDRLRFHVDLHSSKGLFGFENFRL